MEIKKNGIILLKMATNLKSIRLTADGTKEAFETFLIIYQIDYAWRYNGNIKIANIRFVFSHHPFVWVSVLGIEIWR